MAARGSPQRGGVGPSLGEGAGVGKLGSREAGEGAGTDKEKSTTFWNALRRDASPREGPDTKLVCGSRLEAVMKAAGTSGRGARPVPKEAAEHRPGRGSFGISFRATRGTARPWTAATRLPRTRRSGNLSRPGVSLPPGFGCPLRLFALGRGYGKASSVLPSRRKGDGARSRG